MRYKIYTFLVLLLCLVPILGIPFFGLAQPAANETLASAPSLTERDGSPNWELLQDFTDFVADRFALRQEMVTLQHRLTAVTLSESGEEDVILGKDGWLFYADTLADYEGTNRFTDEECWAAAHSLSLMAEYCESQGASFYFTIAPNKNSLYPQYMPARYPASQEAHNAQRLAEALEAQSVTYVDLFTPLSQQEEILYRRWDSHWTQQGAGLAGDTLLAACGQTFLPFYGASSVTESEEVGDLYEMVYPTGTESDIDQVYDRAFTFSYVNPIRSVEDNLIYTENAAQSGSLLMFRDSFGNALHLFMAEGYGSACFSRSNPYDFSLVNSTGCDTVVVELVERNLSWLLTRPALFPAPVRQVDEVAAASDLTVEVTLADSDQLSGYVCVSGDLGDQVPDACTPIYLQVGDTIYEATPAGEGDTPFTAYVPAGFSPADLTLLAEYDGTLTVLSCSTNQ
jgi:hypothetical protein